MLKIWIQDFNIILIIGGIDLKINGSYWHHED